MHEACTGVGVPIPTAVVCRANQSATPSCVNVARTPVSSSAVGSSSTTAPPAAAATLSSASRAGRFSPLFFFDTLRRFSARPLSAVDGIALTAVRSI
jgi:hypothetical protein